MYNFPSLGRIGVVATVPLLTFTATLPVFTHSASNRGPQKVIEVGNLAGRTYVSSSVDVLHKDHQNKMKFKINFETIVGNR